MGIHCPLYTYSSGLPTCDNLLHVGEGGGKHVQFFSWGNLCLLAADFFGATLPPSPEHRRGTSSSSSSSATGTTTTGRGSWKEGRGGPSPPLVCGKSGTCVYSVLCAEGKRWRWRGSALNVSDFGSKPCCRSLSRPGIPLLPTPPPGGFGFTRVSLPETPGPGGATGRLLFESELIFE